MTVTVVVEGPNGPSRKTLPGYRLSPNGTRIHDERLLNKLRTKMPVLYRASHVTLSEGDNVRSYLLAVDFHTGRVQLYDGNRPSVYDANPSVPKTTSTVIEPPTTLADVCKATEAPASKTYSAHPSVLEPVYVRVTVEREGKSRMTQRVQVPYVHRYDAVQVALDNLVESIPLDQRFATFNSATQAMVAIGKHKPYSVDLRVENNRLTPVYQ
ncbi:MAG: hypothetical protein WC254_01095 [Candidatus Woesearchaeota archaeon]|jgi:hypothetical protein